MLKNILKIEGAQQLSNNEQKEINGGKLPPKSCGSGGTVSNVNNCLCQGSGVYSYTTQTCSNGLPTGNLFENATSCCYVSL